MRLLNSCNDATLCVVTSSFKTAKLGYTFSSAVGGKADVVLRAAAARSCRPTPVKSKCH